MIVAVAFHHGEVDRVKSLFAWIAELGSCNPHSLLLAVDSSVAKPDLEQIQKLAKKSFDVVMTIPQSVKTSWPPNGAFLGTAQWIRECCKLPWFWLESDAVPLKAGWADAIADEYAGCAKQYMGPIIRQTGQAGLPEAHMTGVSVYPVNAFDDFSGMQKLNTEIVAWDIESAAKIVPRARDTKLIHHTWGARDLPPHFVEKKAAADPKNFVTLDYIQKDAVVFHRVKTESLINLLRKNLNPQKAK